MVLQYIETDGGKLAVDVEGKGPLVICAPGMGDFRDAYIPLASQIVKRGYMVACMDNRGHGDSSAKFNRYGDEPTADDFLLVANTLTKGPAVLIGNSFAAGSATIAAGRAAGREKREVAGVVLLAPFLRPTSAPMMLMSVLFARPWGSYVWKYYAKTLFPGLGAEKSAERAAASTESLTRPGRWSAFQATVSGLDHSVVTPWLPSVKNTPALVVMGDKDPDWSKPVEEAEWVCSNFANHKSLIVEGAGHAPQLERPEQVGKAVLEFLDNLREQGALATA